ncbi:peptidase E [Nocardioides iriomotensis]|uniref:Peptidase E n=1 Tax=Nocardioides iriomotensis TaxID=715784 RepID=A0A4Q5IV44_9ACTN|nr:peptidase E [Nocardioides iriomotensis]RYU08769.1 peptidase E [Nocardioides iriomotensis]
MVRRRIFALGGGGFSMEPDNPALDDYLLSLVRDPGRRPKVCFVPTASGDAADYVRTFEEAFAGRADTSVLRLFTREQADLRSFLLPQDVVYVGGGSTANLLAVWRLHGLPEILAEAADRGTVLAGISAGMNCWFEASVTDSFGPGLAPLRDGLGFVPGSSCPHYDGEELRAGTYRALVAEGFPGGYAADDGCGLLFEDGELTDVVASRPGADGYRVELVDGRVVETPLEATYLGGYRGGYSEPPSSSDTLS